MIALGLGLALVPVSAFADSGNFQTDDGPSCYWNGSGNYVNESCSGYSRAAREYVNYTCDVYFNGGNSSSWSCRDIHGATWRGSN